VFGGAAWDEFGGDGGDGWEGGVGGGGGEGGCGEELVVGARELGGGVGEGREVV
jgi:hypothetical protein